MSELPGSSEVWPSALRWRKYISEEKGWGVGWGWGEVKIHRFGMFSQMFCLCSQTGYTWKWLSRAFSLNLTIILLKVSDGYNVVLGISYPPPPPAFPSTSLETTWSSTRGTHLILCAATGRVHQPLDPQQFSFRAWEWWQVFTDGSGLPCAEQLGQAIADVAMVHVERHPRLFFVVPAQNHKVARAVASWPRFVGLPRRRCQSVGTRLCFLNEGRLCVKCIKWLVS